ncbi:MAG: HAMP domain-containing sensor histidine kinase [Sulfitobacter sp.]
MTGMVTALAAAAAGDAKSRTEDVDDFIYLISHDARASIRALIELPQWIEDDLRSDGVVLGGGISRSIEMMNQHAGRLDQMLVDLLAYSRIGRIQTIDNIDVSKALDDVMKNLNRAETFQITRQINLPFVAMGDHDASLMLHALIENAVKHHQGPHGHIRIRTQREGEMFRLTVSDDGPGIPAHLHARAMAPMTTLRPRDEVEGTGMGLAIVGKIASHYGGHMALSKAQDHEGGLQIDVVLPRRPT